MRKLSPYRSLWVGLLSVAAQIVAYVARFGRWNAEATLTEYLLFFVAGTLGGLILIYFLNRQEKVERRWVVLVAFLLASPVALIFMLGGGLLGWFGVILSPQIPWALMTWIGSIVGKWVLKG